MVSSPADAVSAYIYSMESKMSPKVRCKRIYAMQGYNDRAENKKGLQK